MEDGVSGVEGGGELALCVHAAVGAGWWVQVTAGHGDCWHHIRHTGTVGPWAGRWTGVMLVQRCGDCCCRGRAPARHGCCGRAAACGKTQRARRHGAAGAEDGKGGCLL